MPTLLDQLLAEANFSGGIFARCEYRGDWQMALATDEPHMLFHLITEGRTEFEYLGADRSRRLQLSEGDIVVLPYGDPHRLWRGAPTPAPPTVLNSEALGAFAHLRHGTEGATCAFLCGYYRFEYLASNPWMRLLPRVMHIPSGHDTAQIASLASLIDREAVAVSGGSLVLMNRLTEGLLLYLLRAWTRQDPHAGILAALADARVGKALAALHRSPEMPWTVARLGREANLSRAGFAKRFQQLVGCAPIEYLADLRMLRAMELLRRTRLPLEVVAERSGYQSPAAFGKAFKKHTGHAPRRFRQLKEPTP